MYCPTCGSEERQLSQYCRACGTDLRVVRRGLERSDTITASAVSAREQISQALADKIREMKSAEDLKQVAEEVLPEIEKFLESPEEKRLRRIRNGVVTAGIGLGGALLFFLMSLQERDMLPFISLGVILFLIGIGLVINGLAFTIPRKTIDDRSDEALSQREFESLMQNAPSGNQLPLISHNTNGLVSATDQSVSRPSVTEHTTQHLKPSKT